ncbi:ParB/RepB/Spo0J family partition protein [Mycobacteroides abscessus subsp. massiliense]|uniref:ParB/RepB/Spo0J family partition protein n=1 Tax=Mycobacteroides abscessus TaxID=36809 RepID=UPI000926FCDE|nr:ParB/RepB/Spo0J family partition protein [Mycobacteroides abscessus]MBN7428708.1 ParB/RepB/Spo0J family partition protein [Mycobacteroides abscessus subsp. massiliense]SIN48178.1 putative plasmid partitioning protein [Mycobacteroides abscessus subsp. bolletii]
MSDATASVDATTPPAAAQKPRRGGRTNLASLTGAVGSKSTVDGASIDNVAAPSGAPYAVPLAELSSNPYNTRDVVGDLEDLASITEVQLQPAAVVTKAAFLKLYPDAQIDGKWVVINGNRRLAAAHKYGRPDLEIVVKDELAADRSALLAAAIKENLDRKDLDVIEEAKSVDRLVEECGSAAAAAHHLGKSEGWISQRRSLLALAPELQEGLRRGELALRDMRELARVPRVQQVSAWAAMQEKKKQPVGEGRGEARDRTDDGGPTKPPLRSVTKALANFDREPIRLAESLYQYLGDDGLKTLVSALRRISK